MAHCRCSRRSLRTGSAGRACFCYGSASTAGGTNMYMMKAESPARRKSWCRGKVARVILYGMYVDQYSAAYFYRKMLIFDATVTILGTAGTGGRTNDSIQLFAVYPVGRLFLRSVR